MIKIRKSICPYDCPATCGLLMEVENGKIIRVKKDSDHPVSRNGICRKTAHYEKSIYSPKRILTPLKRIGKKGSGKFKPVSWEEAVKEITGVWKKIIDQNGPEAILPWSYSGVMSDIQCKCGEAFFARMGAPKLVDTLCCPAKGEAYESVAGKTGCLDPRELKDSDFYIIWGSNMAATRLQALNELNKPANRGKKKILIETYETPTSKYVDRTICIKAGTDGALALAMMHVLDQEGLCDEAFLKEYAEGYEVFRAGLKQYTPEWAQAETGIAAGTIRELAREYAAANAPAIILGSGNSRYENGGMTVRLIVILSLMTGAWKYPGGGLCGCNPRDGAYVDMDLIERPDFRKKAPKIFNICEIASALDPEGEQGIRALYVYGGNPANTAANQEGIIKGLEREDLFTVAHERFMTETALYADIILPATFSVEQHDIYRSYGYCTLGTAWPVIKPPGECKSNWDTFCLLAREMGYEEEYFRRTEEEMLLYILDHPTKAVDKLPSDKKQLLRQGESISLPYADHLKIRTPSGRMRIVNDELKEAVPRYIRPHISRENDVEPIRLVAAPSLYTLNSEFRDREDLIDRRGEQKLIMHCQDAENRGIKDGDRVMAYNALGHVIFRAVVTEKIALGNAVCEGVFRRDDCQGGSTFNALVSETLSDLGEGTTLNDNRVQIRKC